MRRYHYPYMNGHAIEHGKFLSHLTTIIYDYERGRDNVLQNCSDFVTRWLETHILVNDVELANFLRHRGL